MYYHLSPRPQFHQGAARRQAGPASRFTVFVDSGLRMDIYSLKKSNTSSANENSNICDSCDNTEV